VTSDQAKRAQLMQQAEQILLREMPVLPMSFNVSKNLVSTRVKGWEDDPSVLLRPNTAIV
jgi:oligopeptide transport system substrate-binding protein